MEKIFILLILFAAVLCTAGCTGKTQENSTDSQNTQEKTAVVEATQLEQINASLQKGPVLLKIGAEWCDECQAIKPTLAQIAAEYEGKVTVMSVDIDNSPKLADYFGINVIPDTSVIVGIKNGEYIYILHSAGRHYIFSIFTAIVLETLCEFVPGSKLVNI